MYNSTFGVWLQRDPAGYVDGGNLYEYVNNQPIDRTDKLGLSGTRIEINSWTRGGYVYLTNGGDRMCLGILAVWKNMDGWYLRPVKARTSSTLAKTLLPVSAVKAWAQGPMQDVKREYWDVAWAALLDYGLWPSKIKYVSTNGEIVASVGSAIGSGAPLPSEVTPPYGKGFLGNGPQTQWARGGFESDIVNGKLDPYSGTQKIVEWLENTVYKQAGRKIDILNVFGHGRSGGVGLPFGAVEVQKFASRFQAVLSRDAIINLMGCQSADPFRDNNAIPWMLRLHQVLGEERTVGGCTGSMGPH